MVSETSTREARINTTGLLCAYLMEVTTDSKEYVPEVMEGIVADGPEKLVGVTLTLLNLLYQYVTVSGTNPKRFQDLNDHMIQQLGLDT